MLAPSKWSQVLDQNNEQNKHLQYESVLEYNCKIMYSSWGNNLDSTTASIIWYNYFKDRNITIVKVVYNINGTYVKEMEGNMLIITNYTNFSEVLNDYPHILEKYQNTLFIFHKVTWEEVILKDILFLH